MKKLLFLLSLILLSSCSPKSPKDYIMEEFSNYAHTYLGSSKSSLTCKEIEVLESVDTDSLIANGLEAIKTLKEKDDWKEYEDLYNDFIQDLTKYIKVVESYPLHVDICRLEVNENQNGNQVTHKYYAMFDYKKKTTFIFSKKRDLHFDLPTGFKKAIKNLVIAKERARDF